MESTQKSLGVPGHINWQSCNFTVNAAFANDWMRSFAYTIPNLLGLGVRVLIYDGDMDFVVNWIGDKAWTLALDWEGKEGFNNLTDQPFNGSDGKIAWYTRSLSGFTFMRFANAGHMVPLDKPENALDMLNRFLDNRPFCVKGFPFVDCVNIYIRTQETVIIFHLYLHVHVYLVFIYKLILQRVQFFTPFIF